MVLAVGEAGNFPGAIKATAEYFPKKERSFATGIFNSGANVGAILAPLSVPWIEANYGWQAAFLVVGAIGFIWLIFWMIYYERPEQQTRMSKEELAYIQAGDEIVVKTTDIEVPHQNIPWVKLLGYNQTWSFIVGKFMTDGVWWFFLFWLPSYFSGDAATTSCTR